MKRKAEYKEGPEARENFGNQKSPFHVLNQPTERHIQRGSDLCHVQQCNIPCPALYITDVRAVNPGMLREFFLRNSLCKTEFSHGLPESKSRIALFGVRHWRQSRLKMAMRLQTISGGKVVQLDTVVKCPRSGGCQLYLIKTGRGLPGGLRWPSGTTVRKNQLLKLDANASR